MQQLIPALAFPPGEILQEELEASELSQKDIAEIEEGLPQIINNIIEGRQKISKEISVKLSQVFGTSPEFWLNLEHNYNLYLSRKLNSH